MKAAVRCLQVFTVLLLVVYSYHFFKFVDNSSIQFWKNETSSRAELLVKAPPPNHRTAKGDVDEWLR